MERCSTSSGSGSFWAEKTPIAADACNSQGGSRRTKLSENGRLGQLTPAIPRCLKNKGSFLGLEKTPEAAGACNSQALKKKGSFFCRNKNMPEAAGACNSHHLAKNTLFCRGTKHLGMLFCLWKKTLGEWTHTHIP